MDLNLINIKIYENMLNSSLHINSLHNFINNYYSFDKNYDLIDNHIRKLHFIKYQCNIINNFIKIIYNSCLKNDKFIKEIINDYKKKLLHKIITN